MTMYYYLTNDGYIDHIDTVKIDGAKYTTQAPKGHFNKAKFDGTKWVDSMTDEELKEANTVTVKPNENDTVISNLTLQLAQSNAQVKELSTKVDTLTEQVKSLTSDKGDKENV